MENIRVTSVEVSDYNVISNATYLIPKDIEDKSVTIRFNGSYKVVFELIDMSDESNKSFKVITQNKDKSVNGRSLFVELRYQSDSKDLGLMDRPRRMFKRKFKNEEGYNFEFCFFNFQLSVGLKGDIKLNLQILSKIMPSEDLEGS